MGLRRLVVRTAGGAVATRVSRPEGDPPGPEAVATVLLHGAAGSWTTWIPLLDAARRRDTPLPDVVALDLPGWGQSGARVPLLPALRASVVEVARALGYRRWRLVGHSLGGFLALDVAAQHPEATVAVGLVSPSGGAVLDAVRRPVRGGMRLPGFAGMVGAMHVLRLLGAGSPRLLRALRASGLLRVLARPLFRHPRRVDRAVTDALADEIRPAAFLRAVAAVRGYDDARWRRVSCPVRSVSGVRDVFARASDDAWFRRRLRDLVTTRLPDAGHFAAVECPDAVLDAFADVLRAGSSVRDDG